MKSLVSCLLSLCAFASALQANLISERAGTWSVTTTTLQNGREVSVKGQVVNKNLQGGVQYSESSEKINGRSVITGKSWTFPSGTSFSVIYESGSVLMLGEGTWQLNGNTQSGKQVYETLDGKVNATSTSTRVNKNRWTGSVTLSGKLPDGSVAKFTGRSVATRTK